MTHEEDLPGLDPEIQALLAVEASAAIPAGAKARVLAKMLDGLGPVGGGGNGDPSPSSTPSPAGSGSILGSAKLIGAGAFLAGAIAGGTAVTVLREPPPPPQIVYVDRPAPPPPAPPEPKPEAPVRSKPEKLRPKREIAEPSLESREQTLIERARAALGRQQPKDALAALEEHRRDFAAGSFVEEREALLALTLWALDRKDEARGQAARFKARYPQSLLGPTIDARIR